MTPHPLDQLDPWPNSYRKPHCTASNTTSRQRQRQLTRLSGRMTRIDPVGHASIAWNAFIRSSCKAAHCAIDTKQDVNETHVKLSTKQQRDPIAHGETPRRQHGAQHTRQQRGRRRIRKGSRHRRCHVVRYHTPLDR